MTNAQRGRPQGATTGILLLGMAMGLWSGCSGDTALVLRITARPGVHDGNGGSPSDLVVTFQSSSDAVKRETTLTPTAGQPFFTTPNATTFSIVANGRVGPSTVTAKARTVDRRVIGVGQTTAVLQDGALVEAPLLLYPQDFVVNSLVAGAQGFSWGATGRQIAADAQGNFAVVFKTWPCTPYVGNASTRCEVFGRLFDSSGVPRINSQGSAGDYTLTPESHSYGSPAIAMQPDGSFAVAWLRREAAGAAGIYVRAFEANGGHSNGQAAAESKVSDDGAAFYAYPDLAATPTGYAVAWLERSDTDYSAKARLLGLAATPQAPTIAVHTMPKSSWVTAPAAGQDWLNNMSIALAADTTGGFMTIFHHACDLGDSSPCWDLLGRFFDSTGQARGPTASLDNSAAKDVGDFDLAPLPYGFAVVWSAFKNPQGRGGDIRMRRFAANSAALEEAWTLNTSLTADQWSVTIASLGDGSLLAAWFTEDEALDAGGGLRGRILLSNGLPVGSDFQLNTSIASYQGGPSATAVGPSAFALTFFDNSQTPPDTLEKSIRGRLLYPNYDARDGQVGSRCSSGQCAPGLVCAPLEIPNRPNEQRCINECTAVGAPCPNGGSCIEIQGAPAPVCFYAVR